jgi:tetratricopeptide (TPR) repeat protein
LEEGAVDSFRLFKIREIDPQRAFDLASGALEQQRTRGARAGEARLLGELGELHRYTENYAQAMERYEEALNLSLELDDRQLEAMALKGIADVHSSMGEKEEAHARYAQAAAIWRKLGNLMAEGRVLSAMTFDVLFDCEKLIPILERKIEVDRAIGLATSGWEQHLDLCRQLVAQKDQ